MAKSEKSIEALEKLYVKRSMLGKKIEETQKKLLIQAQKESKNSSVKVSRPRKATKSKIIVAPKV